MGWRCPARVSVRRLATSCSREEADTAAQLISGEVEGLLAQTVQAASLLIRMSPYVRAVQVLNELPVSSIADAVLAELGSFYSDETRKLLLVFDIPGIAGPVGRPSLVPCPAGLGA